MHKRIFIAALSILLYSLPAAAQPADLYSTAHAWAAAPVLHKVPAAFSNASALYLADTRIFHYKPEGKNIFQYNYTYRLIKVQDDKGIEMFNKIYLPVYPNAEISELRARVITSAGKVMEVPESKIKEEEEDGRRYKLFAMEGIDKGAEVEYSYVIKKSPGFFGSEIFQNKAVPYLQARLLVVTPAHLKFTGKGYNGFTMLPDSAIGEERMLAGYGANIPALDDEKYSYREPFMQRADFKLSYNLTGNKEVEMYTWKEFARKVYPNLTSFTEKENKAVARFADQAAIPTGTDEDAMISMLEDYMKTHINVDDKLVSEDADNIEAIIKTGNTNNFGATRFFAALLDNKKIKYQVVFPSVRNQLPLDEELANWNRIDESVIYFPGTGKFLQPSGNIFRYPYIDPNWAGTRGLFLKGTMIGDVKTAIGKFDTIPMEPFDMHAHNMEVYAKLDATGDSMIIDSKQILKGYGALYYRPIWAFLPKEKQDDAVKDIIRSVAKSENIQNIKTENTKLTDAAHNKPLVISGTIHSAEILERAGNKLLLKAGELIGPQEQMYQEKPRQTPAELQYPHILYRKLSFEIPDGYSIKNPDDLKINIQQKKDGVLTMGFVSDYTIKDKLLVVDVMETYHELKYPMSDFETFKKVINAAADFNKVVLVLEKK